MQVSKNILLSDYPVLKWLQGVVYAGIILYFGREILVPISFSVLISFVLYPVCAWLERKGVRRLMAIALSISLLMILGILIAALLVYQFFGFLQEWPAIQLKVVAAMSDLRAFVTSLGIPVEKQNAMLSKISDQSGGNMLVFLKNTVAASAFSIVLMVLIPVYAILILYYRQYWMKILGRIFPFERADELRKMISLTIGAYYNFIKGMVVVYVVVGSLNSVGLLLLGVPHAILFGFIASILTFIPYVGIVVGSLLPIAMAWITYDSIWYPVGIIGIFTFVQYLEANVIFPVAVSNRLNVNTFVMLVAIFVGGLLWGMAGMILFVPFVGIAKLIADHNPKWRTVSMILGNNG